MKDELITFETAKLAKDKEFAYEFNKQLPDYVPMFYCESDFDDNLDMETLNETECQGEDIVRGDFYFRSTQSLLQKWLRDVHNIDIWVNKIGSTNEKKYYFNVMVNNKFVNTTNSNSKTFLKYEEGLEMGLQEALKLI